MLFNEFSEEHGKLEEQQAAIKQLESRVAQYEDLRSTVAQQQKQIQVLTASLKRTGLANPENECATRRSESVRWWT